MNKDISEVEVKKYLIRGKGLQETYVNEAVRGSMGKFCSVAATISGKAKISYGYEVVDE